MRLDTNYDNFWPNVSFDICSDENLYFSIPNIRTGFYVLHIFIEIVFIKAIQLGPFHII